MRTPESHNIDKSNDMEKGIQEIEIWIKNHESYILSLSKDLKSSDVSDGLVNSIENGKKALLNLKKSITYRDVHSLKPANQIMIPLSGSNSSIWKDINISMKSDKKVYNEFKNKKESKLQLHPSRRYIKKS